MAFDINSYLRETKKIDIAGHQSVRPRITCNDGYSISAQAGYYCYCDPRGDVDQYKTVELGYPSQEDELINDYAEDDDYTKTIYAHVPVEIVNELIEKHGGIKGS